MKHVTGLIFVIAILFSMVPAKPALTLSNEQELIENARITFLKLSASREFGELPRYINEARAIMIFPDVVKGGFILGGEGGSGLLIVRGNGEWSQPAFYTLLSGSIGFQIGVQVSEVIFTIMNDNALQAILENQVKFGAGISIAVGPIGKGIGGNTTTNLDADVYSFAKTAGLFGGFSFDGSGIVKKDSANEAYYGVGATPRGIVMENRYSNPNTQAFLSTLAPY